MMDLQAAAGIHQNEARRPMLAAPGGNLEPGAATAFAPSQFPLAPEPKRHHLHMVLVYRAR